MCMVFDIQDLQTRCDGPQTPSSEVGVVIASLGWLHEWVDSMSVVVVIMMVVLMVLMVVVVVVCDWWW